ncbi:hypothetical protein D3C72_2141700 [compost metagenome]
MPLYQHLPLAVILDEGGHPCAEQGQCAFGCGGNAGATSGEGIIGEGQAAVLNVDVHQIRFAGALQV